jgi:hypothetical protein
VSDDLRESDATELDELREKLATARLIISTLVQAIRKGPNWLLMQGLENADKFLEGDRA